MKRTLTVILVLISTLSYSQISSESDIFKKIINYEIEKGILGIYIQCQKPKTSFDLKDFKEQTELQVPDNILKEIETNATKSNTGIWNAELIDNLNYEYGHINSKKCLTKKDAELLFEQTGKRQSIISISEPIFDKSRENCIVNVDYWKFKGSHYGHSYFLKKVYGIWTIVITYNNYMT